MFSHSLNNEKENNCRYYKTLILQPPAKRGRTLLKKKITFSVMAVVLNMAEGEKQFFAELRAYHMWIN